MKETINQIKNSIENNASRLDHLEDRTSGNEDNTYNFEKNVDHRDKMLRNHKQNFQKLWDKMKRPNLRFITINENMKIQTKGMYSEIMSENSPNLKNKM